MLPLYPHIFRIIQYKALWRVLFVIYMNSYYLYEEMPNYKAEKKKKKNV